MKSKGLWIKGSIVPLCKLMHCILYNTEACILLLPLHSLGTSLNQQWPRERWLHPCPLTTEWPCHQMDQSHTVREDSSTSLKHSHTIMQQVQHYKHIQMHTLERIYTCNIKWHASTNSTQVTVTKYCLVLCIHAQILNDK